jgi:hypothetical protein
MAEIRAIAGMPTSHQMPERTSRRGHHDQTHDSFIFG